MTAIRRLDTAHPRHSRRQPSSVFSTARTFRPSVFLTETDSGEFIGLFECKRLNNCVIQKHILRPHERSYFVDVGSHTTKIMSPIDSTNTAAGWRVVFIGQNKWINALCADIGLSPSDHENDLSILTLLDALPSFDPFLLRESFKRAGCSLDDTKFKLNDREVQDMERFVYSEVSLLFDDAMAKGATREDKIAFVRQILGSTNDRHLSQLRQILNLSPEEFDTGLFAWQGCLYYKWNSKQLRINIKQLFDEISAFTNITLIEKNKFQIIRSAIKDFALLMMDHFNEIISIIDSYNNTISLLKSGSGSAAFRKLIIDAPDMFYTLGRKVGVSAQIIDIWNESNLYKRNDAETTEDLLKLMKEFIQMMEAQETDEFDPQANVAN